MKKVYAVFDAFNVLGTTFVWQLRRTPVSVAAKKLFFQKLNFNFKRSSREFFCFCFLSYASNQKAFGSRHIHIHRQGQHISTLPNQIYFKNCQQQQQLISFLNPKRTFFPVDEGVNPFKWRAFLLFPQKALQQQQQQQKSSSSSHPFASLCGCGAAAAATPFVPLILLAKKSSLSHFKL